MWSKFFLVEAVVVLLAGSSVTLLAGGAVADMGGDWPQWRGPTRDGLVAPGPKLSDSWLNDTPKQVWKSSPIPGYPDGGTGSITVSGGKVFVFVDEACSTPTKLITSEYVAGYGWVPGVPDELSQKLESFRNSMKLQKTTPSDDVDSSIRTFLSTLPPDQAAKFGPAFSIFLKRGGWAWATLAKLANAVGKEIRTGNELRDLIKDTGYAHNSSLQSEFTGWLHKIQQYRDEVICLDAATGHELWRKDFPGTYAKIWAQSFLASGTPAVSGERCYVAGSQGLYCLNTKDGSEVWKTPIWFSNSSPLIVGNAVYVLATPSDKPVNEMGGALSKYDASTGKLLWTVSEISSSWGSSPVVWSSGGKTCILATGDKQLFCVDAEKGAILWRVPVGTTCATPTVCGDLVVVHGDKVRAFNITSEKAVMLWEQRHGGDRMGSPVIYQGFVYYNGSQGIGFGCIDLKTGDEKWRQYDDIAALSCPVIADGKIFVFCVSQKQATSTCSVRMCKCTPEKYEELGRFNPQSSVCSSPAIANGRMYLRLTDGVGCYDLEKHNQ